ncbi:MAG: methionyl-tRNA formyltransferase [bacterium]
MRIIFFGTPEPAAKILEALAKTKHEIALVVSQPDRPKGRGQIISFSPVKEVAVKHKLPVEQPEKVKNNPDFLKKIKDFKADIAVVVAYGKILPKDLLDIPKHGFINLHASLLPKYRGAAPVQWAIINGEKTTGVTIFKIVEQLDAGPIVGSRELGVGSEDNAKTLLDKLFTLGEELLLETLVMIENGTAKFTPQDEEKVTYAPIITKESGELDWKKSANELDNRIRGLFPWPAAHTFWQGKRLKLIKAAPFNIELTGLKKSPGEIIEIIKNEGFVVATGNGNLLVSEVQSEGGRPLNAYQFAIGHDVKIAEVLPS